MKTKTDRRSYPDARLVLGNGFDLKVGLHSSYIDYFKYRKNDYCWFANTISDAYTNYHTFHYYDVNFFPDELPENLSIWDYVFFILSAKGANVEFWYDVEKVIQNCLFSNWGLSFCELAKHLDDLIEFGEKNLPFEEHSDIFFVKHFVLARIRKGEITDEKSFYHYLKNELIVFESSFINYLKEEIQKIKYPDKAMSLVDRIIGKDEYNVTQVDSFNFTGFVSKHLSFSNINGDMSFPIFGVDGSKIKDANDERKIFTKQYRRLERIVLTNPKPSSCGDECIYFYGHSLNEQDYDYFFSLFDKLNLLNEFDRRLVFAYSIYDKSKKDAIKKNLMDGIYALFFTYERSKGIESPKLVTSLISEGKLIIKEI